MNGRIISIIVLAILMAGCTGQSAATSIPPTVSGIVEDKTIDETQSPIQEPTTSQTLTNTATAPLAVTAATATPEAEVNSGGVSIPPDATACSLIPQDKIKDFLGEGLMPPQDSGDICIFVAESGSRSFTVNIRRSEAARLSFLDIISQQKKGCSLSFSGGTRKTPTPLPPEVMQLSSKPLKELARMIMEGYEKCDQESNFDIVTPTLGNASFINFLDLGFLKNATVTVVGDDLYIEFTHAASSTEEIRGKKEALINLVKESLTKP